MPTTTYEPPHSPPVVHVQVSPISEDTYEERRPSAENESTARNVAYNIIWESMNASRIA